MIRGAEWGACLQAVTACLLSGPMDPSRAKALGESRPSIPTRDRSSSWDAHDPDTARAMSGASSDPSSPDRPPRTTSNLSSIDTYGSMVRHDCFQLLLLLLVRISLARLGTQLAILLMLLLLRVSLHELS